MWDPAGCRPARHTARWDPEAPSYSGDSESKWLHASGEVPRHVMLAFRERSTYIGVAEALGAAVPFTSLPNKFKDRDVIHFIDNTGALVGLAKGYSRDVDTSRIAHVFHTVCAAAQANVWFEYVASGANIADLPSRDEFELLDEFGSTPFDIVWPDVSESWTDAFTRVFKSVSISPSRAAKKAQGRVKHAISMLRGWYG